MENKLNRVCLNEILNSSRAISTNTLNPAGTHVAVSDLAIARSKVIKQNWAEVSQLVTHPTAEGYLFGEKHPCSRVNWALTNKKPPTKRVAFYCSSAFVPTVAGTPARHEIDVRQFRLEKTYEQMVSSRMAATSYGSILAAGRRSSRYPLFALAVARGIRMEAPRSLTP